MKRAGVSELDQLHQLYDSKTGRGGAGRAPLGGRSEPSALARGDSYSALHLAQGPSKPALPQHLPSNRLSVAKVTGLRSNTDRAQATEMVRSAARSHHLNDAYVADMEAIMRAAEEAAQEDDLSDVFGPRGKLPGGGRGGVAAPMGGSGRGTTGPRLGGPGSTASASALPRLVDAFSPEAAPAARGGSLPTAMPRSGLTAPSALPVLHRQWWRGPTDPAGQLVKLSDRPVMFIGVAPEGPSSATGSGAAPLPEVVLGTADHASYSVSLARGACTRTLFGRRAGHTEWVTATCFLGDGSGRVATAGMDGKIIVWDGDAAAGGTRRAGGGGGGGGAPPRGPEPRNVEIDAAHFGSISCLCSPGGGLGSGSNQTLLRAAAASDAAPRPAVLISSGYDKVIRLWSTAASGGSTAMVRSSGGGGTLARSGRALMGSGGSGSGSSPLPLLAELRGHGAPILALALRPDLSEYTSEPDLLSADMLLASGDRDGVVKVWDVAACAGAGGGGASSAARRGDAAAAGLVGTLSGHRGHITAMTWASSINRYWLPSGPTGEELRACPGPDPELHSLLFTGAQDGHFRAWDVRSKAPVANIELHVSDGGAGAVGDICVSRVPTSPHFMSFAAGGEEGDGAAASSRSDAGFETLVVTAGADRSVCVLDPRMGFAPRHRFTQHKDFLYSLHAVGPLCFSGAGDGMLITHDLTTGKPLWGLGANMAAVRCIATSGSTLLAAGDDGSALLYGF